MPAIAKLVTALIVVLVTAALPASAQVIDAFAGNGTAGSSGDGGTAIAASLNQPGGVVSDAFGNVYISEQQNHRIRRVDPAGIITTVAGTGAQGFSGDGGLATAAQLSFPAGLAVDTSGNVYVADSGNHRIRRIVPGGMITTVAGSASAGSGGDGGPATAASLLSPQDVLWIGGNLVIADTGNSRIRLVQGGNMFTFVGAAGPGFSGDGGSAQAAQVQFPTGLAFDPNGQHIYVADRSNHRIRRITAGVITTVAGNGAAAFAGDGGPATSASLNQPFHVAVAPSGIVYIADSVNHRVRKVALDGTISTLAGTGTIGSGGDGGPAVLATLDLPAGMAFTPSHTLLVSDMGTHRVRNITFPSAGNPPEAPTLTAVLAGDGQITVSFTENGNGGLPVIEFVATCSGIEERGIESPIVVGGLVNGVTYDCAVYATNAAGASPLSVVSGGLTPRFATVTTIEGPEVSLQQGDPVTFVATVTGNAPSGTVAFYRGAGIATCNGLALVDGQAQCTTSFASAGFDAIRAEYSGDANHAPSTSNFLGHTVTPADSFLLQVSRVSNGSGSIVSTPAGIDCGATCSAGFPPLAVITLQATPATGSVFAGWLDTACSEGSLSLTCTMTALTSDRTVTASFVLQAFVVNTSTSGASGMVNMNGGACVGANCSLPVVYGTPMSLLSMATAPGAELVRWSGVACDGGPSSDPCTFIATAQTSVTAYFGYGLLVSKSGIGSVASVAPGIDCPVECGFAHAAFDPGSSVTLVASGGPGWTFTGWNAVGCSGTQPCTLTMNGQVGVTAIFTETDAEPPRPDFNADGKGDLLFANADGRAAIWLMDGLVSTAAQEIIGAASGWSVVRIGDFDGDGKSDLVWQHTDGRMAIYLMDGMVPLATQQLLNAGPWSVTHTPDLDGDGKSDLVFQNADGTVAAWTMDGTVMTGGTSLIDAGTGWSVARTGDFNGDGNDDLLWAHTDGRHAIWLMNGLAVLSTNQILNAGGWSAAQVADLDHDGKADIVWQHADGTIAAWLMNGASMASGSGLLEGGGGWSVTRTGDFNGDGKADLFFLNADGRAAIWLMDGLVPIQTTQILNAGGGWSAARVMDLDGDGRADIVWQNVDGSVALWLMNGATMTSGSGILGPGTGWSVSGAGGN